MRPALVLTLLAVLAACGTDGPPRTPENPNADAPRATGVTIGGDARIGVIGTP